MAVTELLEKVNGLSDTDKSELIVGIVEKMTVLNLSALVKAIEFSNPRPTRRIALAWRRGFHRQAALEKLVSTIRSLSLPVRRL